MASVTVVHAGIVLHVLTMPALDDKIREMKPDDTVLLPSGALHSVESVEETVDGLTVNVGNRRPSVPS